MFNLLVSVNIYFLYFLFHFFTEFTQGISFLQEKTVYLLQSISCQEQAQYNF